MPEIFTLFIQCPDGLRRNILLAIPGQVWSGANALTDEQSVWAWFALLAIFVIPAVPFLLWAFLSCLKKREAPWLSCLGLALCAMVYAGFWRVMQPMRTSPALFFWVLLAAAPAMPFLLWAAAAGVRDGKRPVWASIGLGVCALLYLLYCGQSRPVYLTFSMCLPDLLLLPAALWLCAAFARQFRQGERPWKPCAGLALCAVAHSLVWFFIRFIFWRRHML